MGYFLVCVTTTLAERYCSPIVHVWYPYHDRIFSLLSHDGFLRVSLDVWFRKFIARKCISYYRSNARANGGTKCVLIIILLCDQLKHKVSLSHQMAFGNFTPHWHNDWINTSLCHQSSKVKIILYYVLCVYLDTTYVVFETFRTSH